MVCADCSADAAAQLPWADKMEAISGFLVDPIARFLHDMHPGMPLVPNRATSLSGSWFLSPRQHVIEFIVYNAFFLTIFFVLSKRLTAKGGAYYFIEVDARRKRTIVEHLATLSLLVTLGYTLYFKYLRGGTLFLLQPCHISLAILIVLSFAPAGWKGAHLLFNMYFYWMWGAILALAFPDLRDYEDPVEIFFFFFEHYLLVVIPFVFYAVGRFEILEPTLAITLCAFSVKAIYHSIVLESLALYTGLNLNYLMSPPTGILEHFGIYYRSVQYAFCCILTFVTRYVLVAIILSAVRFLFRRSSNPKSSASVSLRAAASKKAR
eukprot:Opistho-2@41157